MVIKLDVRKILHGRPRMLTRDLFAVDNHFVSTAERLRTEFAPELEQYLFCQVKIVSEYCLKLTKRCEWRYFVRSWQKTGLITSDINKTKFLLRPRPRPTEVNKGTWRI